MGFIEFDKNNTFEAGSTTLKYWLLCNFMTCVYMWSYDINSVIRILGWSHKKPWPVKSQFSLCFHKSLEKLYQIFIKTLS